ncbi:Signal recognition particle 9 kDa [Brachionus plicatilis]|uniref:Signal recognition particle 9 kDa protein n=1 Tax=Brachionus plicatilis TaxID=10195 RepID=A0A3M7TBT4_BRAPC|nr:Signal recognition particle 9 kDa [Brachionus plicatilis]
MVYVNSWEEFSKSVESLYFSDPMKFRFITKFRANSGLFLKVSNDQLCYQYKTEFAQDVKKAEKLISQLMRHMASKEA